jgi:hypothetical protein
MISWANHPDIIDKDHIGILVAIYAGPACNTHVRRLGSLRHQTKMNFAGTNFAGTSGVILNGM